jgi:hypothetical protein
MDNYTPINLDSVVGCAGDVQTTAGSRLSTNQIEKKLSRTASGEFL